MFVFHNGYDIIYLTYNLLRDVYVVSNILVL